MSSASLGVEGCRLLARPWVEVRVTASLRRSCSESFSKAKPVSLIFVSEPEEATTSSSNSEEMRLTGFALEKLSLQERRSEAVTRTSTHGRASSRHPSTPREAEDMIRKDSGVSKCCTFEASAADVIISPRKCASSVSFSSDAGSAKLKNDMQLKTVDMCYQSTEIHNNLGLGLPVAPKLKKKHSRISKGSKVGFWA
jgi:hypothetical protein